MTDENDSFPRQSARTRRFTLGVPRDVKVAPGGSFVTFLRTGSGHDPVNRLWRYDVASGRETELVDPAGLLAGSSSSGDPEAEARRRERARELASGIVAYDTDAGFTQAVFALAGRAFVVDLASGETSEWVSSGQVFDPRFDPTGTKVAYVSGRALRVTDGTSDRLIVDDRDDQVSWGSAEFIAAEEMHRTRGFWWSPDGASLLVERVDNSPVSVWHIASPIAPWADPASVRYPAAGTANAHVGLFIVGLDGRREPVVWDDRFEYLCDVMWAPRERPVVVLQTRDQREVAIAEVAPDRSLRELRQISDGSWVDLVPGAPAFSGDRLLTVEAHEDCYRLCVDGSPVGPSDVQVRRIVRATDDEVLVIASEAPDEAHVASIALADRSLRWHTRATGVHAVSAGGNVMVISAQSPDADGVAVDVLVDERPRGALRVLAEAPLVRPNVEFLKLHERELRTALVLPTGFSADTKLPVLVDPYGGPGHARVLKARNGFLSSQWFADQGFAVVVSDGRGTPGRGPQWDRAIKGDFAGPVLDDQVAALTELADEHPYLDMARVGIRGWSFGGYLAALAVLRRPDVFHAAVAGAPVTEWRLYDTHYTERFLGHPDADPQSYERSSLLPLAAGLERPLLLIHGMADDNVVVAHTLELSRALLEAGRPHRVLPLSGVTHMTPQETVAENLLNFEIAFFRETLAIDAPTPSYKWRPMLPRRDSPL